MCRRRVINWEAMEDYINRWGVTFYKRKAKENINLTYIKKGSKKRLKSCGIHIKEYPKKTEIYYRKECYVDRPSEKIKVKNTLWDGMGLIDNSIFPQDKNMEGFIYCRNHFFKSCLFRGNVEQYFRDYYGDDYETATKVDMFGNPFKIKDIKVIITENSIKWIKFADLMGTNQKEAYVYYRKFIKKHIKKSSFCK